MNISTLTQLLLNKSLQLFLSIVIVVFGLLALLGIRGVITDENVIWRSFATIGVIFLITLILMALDVRFKGKQK